MRTSFFSEFYSEFIKLASNLEYTLKMLIWEFKHKLMLYLQHQLNFGFKLLSTIFALIKRCLNIYKQMQVINRIRKKSKSSTTIQSINTNIFLKAITSPSQAPLLLSNNNNSFSRLSNSL